MRANRHRVDQGLFLHLPGALAPRRGGHARLRRDAGLALTDEPLPASRRRAETWRKRAAPLAGISDVATTLPQVLRKIKRQKYRCTCGACIETAPAPLKLIKGGRYSVGFAAIHEDDCEIDAATGRNSKLGRVDVA